ncbi:MAG TPA: class I SAM-dependent methyltransferase [Polyangia bacterium]|nr:class I SAM-dependent methyltransferase [Polyangia bacterium]
MDPTRFYDQLAQYYDLIFEDWDASMDRQGNVLAALLTERLPFRSAPMRVLDAAAGIGTQSLPLARRGFHVLSRDLSSSAIVRLRSEAEKRNLVIDAAVADMRTVSTTVAQPVDAVIAFDNSVPHLLTDGDVLSAFQSFYDCLRPGGVCILSVRDYASAQRKDLVHPYGVRWRDGVKYLPLQVWHWQSTTHYDVTLYLIVDEDPAASVLRVTTQYYAVSTDRLLSLLTQAGFVDAQRLDDTIYQPILVARRP